MAYKLTPRKYDTYRHRHIHHNSLSSVQQCLVPEHDEIFLKRARQKDCKSYFNDEEYIIKAYLTNDFNKKAYNIINNPIKAIGIILKRIKVSYLDQINHIAIIHDILQKHSSYNKECIYKLFTFIIPNAIASNDFPIYEAYELLGKKLIQKYKNKKIKIADNPNINMLNNTVTFSQDFFNFTKPTICPLY